MGMKTLIDKTKLAPHTSTVPKSPEIQLKK